MCFTPDVPDRRNYAQETSDTLAAQIANAPELFRARSSTEYGDPAFARLGARTLSESLFGAYDSPGILGIYEQAQPRLRGIQSADLSQQRAADIADIGRYGGAAREAVRASNPDSARIVDGLVANGIGAASRGLLLSPDEDRDARQQVRADYANRGIAYSDSAAFDESLNVALKQRGEQERRQALATGALAADRSFYGDPFYSVLGRQSGFGGLIGGALGQGSGIGGASQFSPESKYAQDIYDEWWNGRNAAEIAGANSTAAVTAASIKAVAGIAAAAAG